MTHSSSATNTIPAPVAPFPTALTGQALVHPALVLRPSQEGTPNSPATVSYPEGNLQKAVLNRAWEIEVNKSIVANLNSAKGNTKLIVKTLDMLTKNGSENSRLSAFLNVHPDYATVVHRALVDSRNLLSSQKGISMEAEKIASYTKACLESGLIEKDENLALERIVIDSAEERENLDPEKRRIHPSVDLSDEEFTRGLAESAVPFAII